MQAPGAPVLLVGTHKDELVDASAEKLSEAQAIIANHISDMNMAKKTEIIAHIQRPSERDWFFAVDSKSRKTIAGTVQCSDPTIGEIRSALDQVVAKDDRKVEGLCVKKGRGGSPHLHVTRVCDHSFLLACRLYVRLRFGRPTSFIPELPHATACADAPGRAQDGL